MSAVTLPPELVGSSPLKLGCFIDNEYHQGHGKAWTLFNPKNAEPLQELVGASGSDVDAAVVAATKAFKTGEWATASGAQRGRWLNKLADLLGGEDEERGYGYAQALAKLESGASGRPVSTVSLGDLPRAAQVFRYYAGWADKYKGDSYAPEDGFYKIVEQRPLGVCAAVTAWNASLQFLAWKTAPALALGNTVIVKPSEKSPLGTLAFGYLIQAAGLPAGAFNILVGDGSVGHALASHMNIQKISFTGSLATSKVIQAAATESNLKRVTLELGGKSPAIVFEDADLDTAIFWSVRAITANSGQICAATSRLFVHERIADTFVARLQDAFEAIGATLGADPQDPTTTYGPLVDRTQYEKVLEYISEGKKSAEILTGGEEQNRVKGYYVAPTLFRHAERNSKIYREEIFGPVLCVDTFKTEEQAIQMANDTDYGLAGSIYTQNISRAIRIWRQVEAGTVCVNCAAMVGPQVPTGGFKNSGFGRELGEYALHHYAEPRTIWINMAT